MKKILLMCGLGVALSGCTVTTVQTHTRFPSAHANTYVHHQPRYVHRSHQHHVYPYCRTTYQRGFYGELRAVRVCY
jgi:hypothetical protein